VNKGYSGEEKYYIETADGQQQFLRVSGRSSRAYHSSYEFKENLFNKMSKAAESGIPMCDPIDFGKCNNGKNIYLTLTWIDGEDLEILMPSLSETKRYALGIKAGEILRKIHSIQAPETEIAENWHSNYINGARNCLESFSQTGLQINGSDTIARYFEDNMRLINDRPLSFVHGDYHTGNFMVTKNGELFVVDWDLCGYGDPWNDFSAINNADVFPHFTTGLIRGYFGGEPPAMFWNVTAIYLSVGALSCVNWAAENPECLESCVKNANDTLIWFDNMKNPVPTWYLKDFYANAILCNSSM
jgi:serine/threonine-protein kinase